MGEKAKELLLDALLSGDTDRMIQTASEIIHSPIMLVDSDYSYITHYPKGTVGDSFWDDIIKNGRATVTWINELEKDNMMPIGDNMGIHILDWGFLKDSPKAIVALKDESRHYGFLSVITKEYTEEFKEQVLLIASVLLIHRKNSRGNMQIPVDQQTMFMTYLLNNKITSDDEMQQWIRHLEIKMKPEYRILVLHMQSNESARVLFHRMVKSKKHLLIHIEENCIFVLIWSAQSYFESYLKDMKASLKYEYCIIGISSFFDELQEAAKYKEEALLACHYGKKHSLQVCYYEDCIMDQILTTIYHSLDSNVYFHPAIKRLKKYDAVNNTHLTETLRCYLKNQFNVKITIEELGIHRNSLPKRMERIKEIGRIDLNDHNTCLLLSIGFLLENFDVNFEQK